MTLGAWIAGGNSTDGRIEGDFYPTPIEVTRAFLRVERFNLDTPIWEPAAGDGAIVDELKKIGITVVASDINPRREDIKKADFLEAYGPSIIVTNPPFVLAEKFVRRAHHCQAKYVALLLKATFWHAKRRTALWNLWQPARIYALTWRPDFLNKGAPTMDCIWCVWDGHNKETMYKLLPEVQNN